MFLVFYSVKNRLENRDRKIWQKKFVIFFFLPYHRLLLLQLFYLKLNNEGWQINCQKNSEKSTTCRWCKTVGLPSTSRSRLRLLTTAGSKAHAPHLDPNWDWQTTCCKQPSNLFFFSKFPFVALHFTYMTLEKQY